jgi:hypothetical protein
VGRARYKYVPVRAETYGRLLELRSRVGVRTFDELLSKVVAEYSRCVEQGVRERVRQALCNDLSEARATMQGWARLLLSRLGDAYALLYVREYLVPDERDPEVYVVDRRRCAQQP